MEKYWKMFFFFYSILIQTSFVPSFSPRYINIWLLLTRYSITHFSRYIIIPRYYSTFKMLIKGEKCTSDFRDLIPIRDILIPPLVWVKMNVKVEWGSNSQTRSERGIRNKYDNFELFNNKILRLRNSWIIEMLNFWYLFGL